MSNTTTLDNDRRIFVYLSLGCNLFGLLLLLLNFLGIGAIGVGTFWFGLIAFVLACMAKSVKLILFSLFVMPSFLIAIRVVSHIDAASLIRYDAPAFVERISRKGYIYNIIQDSEKDSDLRYIYFACLLPLFRSAHLYKPALYRLY